jgi:hypothetical protein
MAREIARSWEGRVSRRLRKKIEMLFAHLKRILKLDRLRLRGPTGARDEFILAATAQNLRKMAKLYNDLLQVFFNEIGQKRRFDWPSVTSAPTRGADVGTDRWRVSNGP